MRTRCTERHQSGIEKEIRTSFFFTTIKKFTTVEVYNGIEFVNGSINFLNLVMILL